VVRRTGEIGIRIAQGAARRDVLWMIPREALLPALAGVAIGIPPAVVVGGWHRAGYRAYCSGCRRAISRRLVASATLLPIVAMLAAYVPAKRASRLDPMAALRNE
jgi:ABC-type antimicrobial peptide transport system permease subunit